MTRLRLVRVTNHPAVTCGVLLDERGLPCCVTLEEPWRENARGTSCIPPGTYTARRRVSPKRGVEVFQLDSVPDRTAIQIHTGNTTADIEGCILLGAHFGELDGVPAVLGSRMAFGAFMARYPGPIVLEVVAAR